MVNIRQQQAGTSSATLQRFRHFHGMLCSPRTAQKCVQDFRGGAILFMPHNYALYGHNANHSLQYFDYTNRLNVFTYYFLVIASFTGLMSLLRRTRLLVARDEFQQLPIEDPVCTEFISDPLIVVDDNIKSYIKSKKPDVKELYLQRRFEFDFGILTVIMVHLRCNRERLHLVEVYRLHNPIVKYIFQAWKWFEIKFIRGIGEGKDRS